MSVLPRIRAQHIKNSAAKAIVRITLQPQTLRHTVGALKANAVDLITKQIRILFCHIHGVSAPFFIDTHCHGCAEKLSEKEHGRANSRLIFKVLRNRLCALGGNSGN